MNNYNYLILKAKQEGIQKNVVGAIIENQEGKILIVTRKQDDFLGGADELPGGNMEKGEDICAGLRREIKEETNFDFEKIKYFVDTFDYVSESGKKSRQYNFVVKVKDINNIILTEHDAYKWQNGEEALQNPKITAEVKRVIGKYIKFEEKKEREKNFN